MIWWINYDFNWVRWSDEFHEHKISNTGWVRNGDEREGSGTERNQKECSTFLNLHFLDQKWSKDLEFCTCKTERTLQIQANIPFTRSCLRTSLFNMHTSKAGNQCNEASLPWKRAQRYLNMNYGEISLRRNLLHCRQKPQPLCETKWNGKQGKCSQTNST